MVLVVLVAVVVSGSGSTGSKRGTGSTGVVVVVLIVVVLVLRSTGSTGRSGSSCTLTLHACGGHSSLGAGGRALRARGRENGLSLTLHFFLVYPGRMRSC